MPNSLIWNKTNEDRLTKEKPAICGKISLTTLLNLAIKVLNSERKSNVLDFEAEIIRNATNGTTDIALADVITATYSLTVFGRVNKVSIIIKDNIHA
tara:strand:- start:975 stop:1265 length:291 start_codon:yes stop_codon:yes gene_type:complete